MEKQPATQLELFSQAKDSRQARGLQTDKAFFTRVRNYEKTIMVIIAITGTGIISFGIGVEKGKKISMSRFNSRFDVTATAPQKVVTVSVAQKVMVPDHVSKETVNPNERTVPKFLEKQGYVIQLASYKNRSLAEKEVNDLKKQGLNALVLTKGTFTVLYVGNLANKELALSLLPELRKRYRDCYIRRL